VRRIAIILGISLLFSITSSEGAMNTPEVIKLSDIQVGHIDGKGGEYEQNDPVPIVLWSAKGPAAVLQYNEKIEGILGKVHLKQKLRKIYGDGATGFKSMTDDYPISVTSKSPELTDWTYSDKIEPRQILTADVNGDGTDELIMLRYQGSVNVYTARRELFHDKPLHARNGLYEYRLASSHIANLKDGDVVFLTINRWLTSSDEVTSEDRERDKNLDNYALVRIDKSGITTIKLQGLTRKPIELRSAGTINLPGSDAIDELVICSQTVGEQDLYISRHRPDGTLIAEPRKIYVDVGTGDGLAFAYTPHSVQLLFYSQIERHYQIMTPQKKVNWIRKIDLVKDAAVDKNSIMSLGVIKHENGLVFLARSNNEFYAVDEESRFYTWQDNKLVAGKEHVKKVLFTFNQESPLHEVITVVPANMNSDEFLIVQSRKPQARKVANDELIKAGKRFLDESEFAGCEENRKPRYNRFIQDEANNQTREKGLNKTITSLEDIQKYVPEYYESIIKSGEDNFYICLKTRLLAPVEDHNEPIRHVESGSYYRNQKEYVEWLKGVFISGEVVFTSVGLRGNDIRKWQAADYYFDDVVRDTEFSDGPVKLHSHGNNGAAVMSLSRKNLKAGEESAYYMMRW